MPLGTNLKKSKSFTPQGIILILILLFFGGLFAYLMKETDLFDPYRESDMRVLIDNIILPKKHRIGFVTDAHARATRQNDILPAAKVPMEKFISRMNTVFLPDFTVDGGDFIEGTRRFGAKSRNDFLLFDKFFQQLDSPEYHVIGNHDLRGLTRQEWTDKTKNKNSYYYFDFDETLRVIIFDSTLITASSDEKNSERIAYEKELDWLEETLKNSRNRKIIVFSHHPPIPALRKAMPIEAISRLDDIFSKYRVRAVFSGHVEVAYYEKIGGVDYFAVPGFYRSELTGFPLIGSFSEINIGYRNSLTLYYKKSAEETGYRTLLIPSDEYYAFEKEEKEKVNFLAPDREDIEEKGIINSQQSLEKDGDEEKEKEKNDKK
jgi:hypothetical protein